jgi:hypothetical protein
MTKALARGTYLARCKEVTRLAAVANGHSTVWPESIAVSEGAWVEFFKDRKRVFDCNPAYASTHFFCTPVESG